MKWSATVPVSKVVKNKIAPPFKEAEFDIMFGEGISVVGDILDLAANINVVNKSGAWYAYEAIRSVRDVRMQELSDRTPGYHGGTGSQDPQALCI